MTFTLVGDGSSDAVLVPILTWCLKQQKAEAVIPQWADFSRIPRQPNLKAKLQAALDLYPCDLLFVHRDAEGQAPDLRRAEIAAALHGTSIAHIPVIPVRMTEAWLLGDEIPIRFAAGNPEGTADLHLPSIRDLESVPDPKRVLHEALVAASGLNTRRRARFPVQERIHLITHYTRDYSVLEGLSAFQSLQDDIRSVMQGNI